MHRLNCRLVAVLLVGSLPLAATAQTQLKWKLQRGAVIEVSTIQDANIAMKFGEQPIETKMTTTTSATWTVNQVDAAGVANVTQAITSVKLKVESPFMNFEYDSATGKTPEDAIGKMIVQSTALLTKAKFNFVLQPHGEVTDVTISPETEKLFAEAPTAPGMAAPMNKDTLVAMIRQTVVPLPKEKAQKGTMWTAKRDVVLPQVGKMISTSKLTYEGPMTIEGRPLEKIGVLTTSEIAPGASAQATIKEQSDRGTIFFDNVAGRISHFEGQQKLAMDVKVAGQNITQTVTATSKSVFK